MTNTIEWRNIVQMQVDAGQKAAAMQREAALQAAAIAARGFEKGATMGKAEKLNETPGIIGYLDGKPIYKEEW